MYSVLQFGFFGECCISPLRQVEADSMFSRIQPDLLSRTSLCQEKITQRRALHHLLDHLVQFNVCTPVTDVTLSADFQPNALIFKPDATHDAKIFEEQRSVRPCSDIQMMSNGDSDEGGSDLQIVKAFRV